MSLAVAAPPLHRLSQTPAQKLHGLSPLPLISTLQESIDDQIMAATRMLVSDGHVQGHDSASFPAETLLVALRNVIISLVGQIGGQDTKDIRQVPFGPEGEEFLRGLQKFISFVAHPQPAQQGEVTTQKPPFPETSATTTSEFSQGGRADLNLIEDEEPLDIERPLSLSIPPEQGAVVIGSSKHPNENQRQPTSLEKLLSELRLRVFNKMPIRLLCFETHGSEFNISLLERGQIYAHLARTLKTDFDNDNFVSEITGYTQHSGDPTWAEHTVIKNWVSRVAKYAILSHTWLRGISGEVTYSDWQRGSFNVQQPGYQKLLNFCKVAAADHGLAFGWMDTVCINKDSSSELDESIRSMYQWYRDSRICITYLAETWDMVHMHQDPWFTRGWTLQELLAPPRIKFYDANWKKLIEDQPNDKADTRIRRSIETATTITPTELYTVHNLSISRRMQWAAQRQVTREEDIAYCLMGIFGVSIAIAYGEGARRAFFRLVKEILNSSQNILDLFNWAGSSDNKMSLLLPPSPASYLHRHSSSTNILTLKRPTEPLTLTHLGLRIPVLLVPGVPTKQPSMPFDPIGDYYGTVNIAPISEHGHPVFLAESPLSPNSNTPKFPLSYHLLDAEVSETMTRMISPNGIAWKVVFGILNVQFSRAREGFISIPDNCLAVALLHRAELSLTEIRAVGSLDRVETQAPIVFRLKKREPSSALSRETSPVPVKDMGGMTLSQVALHGMRLLTVYL